MDNRICGRCHRKVVRECQTCSSCYTAYHPSCYRIKNCCKSFNNSYGSFGQNLEIQYGYGGGFSTNINQISIDLNAFCSRICGRCHTNVVRECRNCTYCNTPYHPSCYELKKCCQDLISNYNLIQRSTDQYKPNLLVTDTKQNLITLDNLSGRVCGRCHKNVVRECRNCTHCNTPYHPSCYELKKCCQDLISNYNLIQRSTDQYKPNLLVTDTKQNPTSDALSVKICGRCNKNVVRECKNCPQCEKPYHPSCFEMKTCCKELVKNYNLGGKPENKHDSIGLFADKKENSKESENLDDKICGRCHKNVVRECKNCSQCNKSYHPSCYKIKTCCKNLNDNSCNDTKLLPKSNKNEESDGLQIRLCGRCHQNLVGEHKNCTSCNQLYHPSCYESKSCCKKLNESSKWIHPKSEKSPFKVGLLNARSMIKKFPTIQELVKEQNLSVFGVTETWLKEHHKDSSISIEGYQHFRCDRNKRGGGLILYVKDGMKCKKINLPSDIDRSEVQQLWCEIEHENKTRAIGLIYRPPNVQYQKLNYIHDAVEKISSNYDDFTVMGDFNVHYSNEKETRQREVLRQLERDFNMTQLVEEPTRHDKKTASLLDHVYSNHPESWKNVANMENDFSDHNLIVCTSQY